MSNSTKMSAVAASGEKKKLTIGDLDGVVGGGMQPMTTKITDEGGKSKMPPSEGVSVQ